ncbi:MAG TPA: hypothetical protein VKD71_14845 [Gemmataceae bacterium]|nr:hypothetical protein [Gemmataceae bacterium]
MSKLTLPPEFRGQLEKLREPTDLVDESGRPIGRFVPQAELDRLTRPASDEELRRRLAAKEKTYTTAEVLRHLESL